MKFLLIISTIIFLFSVFVGTSHVGITNPFLAYIFYELEFLIRYFPIIFIGYCCMLFFFFINQLRNTKNPRQTNYLQIFSYGTLTIITGALLAFLILMILAFLELNIFSLLMTTNPKLLGITTNTHTIARILQSNTQPPQIIASDKSSKKEVVAVALVTGNVSAFYGQTLLSGIPDIFIFPVKKPPSSLVLLNNTLIVTGIVNKDIQEISPAIGYLFVQEYFPNKKIRKYPKVQVMTQKEYEKFRQSDATQKLAKVDEDIQKMEDGIVNISSTIKSDQAQIVSNSQSQENALKQRDKEYNSCLSTGSYTNGVFQPKFTKDYCQTILDTWETTLVGLSNDADKLTNTLQRDQQTLKDYQYYDDFFKAQKKLGAITTGNISSELGVFEPTDTIKVVINTTSSHAIADYFETLVHEYLHYASYTSGKRLDSSFFEEGLTEYFARQTIKDNLDVDTNTGYPLPVKVISILTNRIAEVDLADIFFSKNQSGLQHALDLAYGDGFYQNNYILFESLLYTSDPQDALDTANTLMKHLGEQELKTEDVFSTQSNF